MEDEDIVRPAIGIPYLVLREITDVYLEEILDSNTQYNENQLTMANIVINNNKENAAIIIAKLIEYMEK